MKYMRIIPASKPLELEGILDRRGELPQEHEEKKLTKSGNCITVYSVYSMGLGGAELLWLKSL